MSTEASTETGLSVDDDGRARCRWGASAPEYVEYHDTEWGVPLHGDDALYERLCLEAFQSGLSWLTILRKRPAFRRAFDDFRIERVADFDDFDVARLLADASIVRNRAKIDASIHNARVAAALDDEPGRAALVLRADGAPGAAGRDVGRRRGHRPNRPRWPRISSAADSGSSGRRPPTR